MPGAAQDPEGQARAQVCQATARDAPARQEEAGRDGDHSARESQATEAGELNLESHLCARIEYILFLVCQLKGLPR